MVDQQVEVSAKRERLLRKLRQVFRDGYRPARGKESYNVKLQDNLYAYQVVNCLGHIFNLRNQQLLDYQIVPDKLYGAFPGMFTSTRANAVPQLVDFIQAAGLQVAECDPQKPIKDFKSWKIGLYFCGNAFIDFHFLLQDAPHQWSSKCGFLNNLEQLNLKTPPPEYCNKNDKTLPTYEFYGTYQITNPYADANNRYVSERSR